MPVEEGDWWWTSQRGKNNIRSDMPQYISLCWYLIGFPVAPIVSLWILIHAIKSCSSANLCWSFSWSLGLSWRLSGKEPAGNAGDWSLIPGSARSLEKKIATHTSILAWRISWTEEPGELWSMGSQRVRHDLVID